MVALLLVAATAAAGADVSRTVHNLSASGPGTVRAQSETRICVFCHTPHNADPTAQLWNRSASTATYNPYASSTMDAAPGQPTGSSRLCLGCHDGTIALGDVLSEADPIAMSGGVTTMPAGPANLGTSLHDDHPVSFPYTAALAAQDGELVDPALLPPEFALDADGMMQCTTCHDPHDDTNGKFLVRPDDSSQFCEACHAPAGWNGAAHDMNNLAGRRQPGAKRALSPDACENCHQVHGAAGNPRLLQEAQEEQVCLFCHNASIPAPDVQTSFDKPYRHPLALAAGVHDPAEQLPVTTLHVECTDCHDPHAAVDAPATAPNTAGSQRGVAGLDGDGQPVAEAVYAYQVCYKCHAGGAAMSDPATPRQIVQADVRLEFDPGNPSFHPVEAPGVSDDVPSLLSPYTTSSIIYCTDCHTDDESVAAGGTLPGGAHGSSYPHLLGWNYETTLPTAESPTAYELCYRCHDRASILADVTFGKHRKHIQNEDTPCNVCHDPHGISATQGDATNHSRLINFDLTYVLPENGTGVIEFVDEGDRTGSCTLRCHGKNHLHKSY